MHPMQIWKHEWIDKKESSAGKESNGIIIADDDKKAKAHVDLIKKGTLLQDSTILQKITYAGVT